ncbi:MAG: 4-hydroxy-3-methylbut-2-en-1-yl diphosphate synthase [Bacteroidota bacterium]|nr:4-hydroxy-3-methylbut-2-en-1-yl diphosphate synthase [Bacteroidota bacterium]
MWKLNQFNYSRRPSDTIRVGNLLLGGNQPVRVQSMANTDTNDLLNSVAQCKRIVDAGGELVRFTAQGVREAESLKLIHDALRREEYEVPLVADIHFNANAADVAALHVEKVRINPGNYVASIKKGDTSDYTREEYELEYEKIKDRFIPFLAICKKQHTAIRIGVNHGSLSERIMNRYGDTSRGMVESCMEFLRICKEENFHDVVISMKTSNTVLMVQTVRLLVDEMAKEGFHYPLHLGVTEAGDGEDGRIKSAVGIGALLADGMGDTIRVSLSEEPEAEIPVARLLVSYISERADHKPIDALENRLHPRYEYKRRKTAGIGNIGGDAVPVVIAAGDGHRAIAPDYVLSGNKVLGPDGATYPVYCPEEIGTLERDSTEIKFLKMTYPELTPILLGKLTGRNDVVVLLQTGHKNGVGEQRAFFHSLLNVGCTVPVVLWRKYHENDLQQLQVKAAADLGVLFIDGFGDGILLENEGNIPAEKLNSIAFGILQASRVRVTKTEYISCPGCGRTMFNLQTVIANVKARTSHLKGLKIGIMGCIVNGPGEMADADYGYVGAGRGKVSLYKKKECVQRSIPEADAVDRLIELIKENGDWHE